MMKENIQLNIMVCGETGVGKTKFIDMFIKKFNLKQTNERLNSRIHPLY